MRIFFITAFMCVFTFVSAQKILIKGQLADSTGTALPSATVLLLNPKDSSLVSFGQTNNQGAFELKNVARAEYLFKVTYVGYAPHTQKISPGAEELVIDIGKVTMLPERRLLDEVTIRAERAPVTIKKDTIEFNAGSFKTKPNAAVEDLLKQLPTVEVDNDGTIRAQGQQVQRVTVDGKEFFGRDPKLATRNLPADAVDKVQVFDRQSDQSQFTGIDDGQREKTINLELKEEKRNGLFGTLTGGAGTEDRYTARASLNRFSKGNQLSVLGMGNNINEQGFSIGDYMNFTGGSQQMMSGGGVRIQMGGSGSSSGPSINTGSRNNGIMTNIAGGVNFNNYFGKDNKTQLNGNYFYNYLDHNIIQNTYRENFLPDGNYNYDQLSKQHNTNNNHRANLILDHKIDSANSIKWTNNFTFNQTESNQQSISHTFDPEGTIQNESKNLNQSSGSTTTLNSNFLYRHKFGKKGRTFSTNITFNRSETDRDGLLNATNIFYQPELQEQVINQENFQTNENTSYGATISYTEPLGNRRYLEANYTFNQNLNDVNREVYDINNEERELNTALSNEYSSDYKYQRAGLNFRMNRTKYTLTLGANFQNTNLEGDLRSFDANINRTFQNVLPVARLTYQFTSTKNLRLDYEANVQEPSIQQLQPVIDNSDPLNITAGNPNLKPAYLQSWRANFSTFDPVSFIGLFVFADVSYTTNAIVNAQYVNERQVRTTIPVNVDNAFSASGNATLSFPVNKIKSRFNISGNVRNQRSVTLLNDVENQIDQIIIGANVRYSFRYKEIFDFAFNPQLSYQKTVYEFDQPDQKFLNQTYATEANVYFLKNYSFNTTFDYLVYASEANDYKQTIPLLNVSVSRFLLKNKKGELKLSANNVLDKNLGITQTATSNYFERTTYNSLGRYYMISFTYALNKHLNPMGNSPRGGRMMIMRQ